MYVSIFSPRCWDNFLRTTLKRKKNVQIFYRAFLRICFLNASHWKAASKNKIKCATATILAWLYENVMLFLRYDSHHFVFSLLLQVDALLFLRCNSCHFVFSLAARGCSAFSTIWKLSFCFQSGCSAISTIQQPPFCF